MAENKSNSYIWLVAGAIVGVGITMLYAPKSGKQTRQLIGETAEAKRESLTSSGKELLEQGKDLYDRGRALAEEAASLFERGRKLVKG